MYSEMMTVIMVTMIIKMISMNSFPVVRHLQEDPRIDGYITSPGFQWFDFHISKWALVKPGQGIPQLMEGSPKWSASRIRCRIRSISFQLTPKRTSQKGALAKTMLITWKHHEASIEAPPKPTIHASDPEMAIGRQIWDEDSPVEPERVVSKASHGYQELSAHIGSLPSQSRF